MSHFFECIGAPTGAPPVSQCQLVFSLSSNQSSFFASNKIFARMSDNYNYPVTLQPTPLHCNPPRYIAAHSVTLQPTPLHCSPPRYIAAHSVTLQPTSLHCNPLRYIASHLVTLQPTSFHFSPPRYIAVHPITSQPTPLHCNSPRYIAAHPVTLQTNVYTHSHTAGTACGSNLGDN